MQPFWYNQLNLLSVMVNKTCPVNFNIVSLFACLFLLFSCGTKTEKTFHENGQLMESFAVDKNGIKNGTYEAFYDDGVLYEKATYKEGKLIGKRILHFTNGQPEIVEHYNEKGELDGPYITYYKNGQIKAEKTYKKNKLEGKVLVYYENGKLFEEVYFKDSQENGPFTEYFENGKVQWKGTYLNGPNEFGELEEFDSTGILIKKMMCDSFAICRSTWKIENYDQKYKQ